jgi:ABC-type dipeptide/oligopeptide/nickel transport system permease subunit
MAARRAAWLLLALGAVALAGPWLAPYDPSLAHRGYLHAPPMWPRLSSAGVVIHPVVLADRLDQRFVEDRTRTVPWPWTEGGEPVFLFGADRTGRDVFSRVLAGARVTLGLGILAVLGATVLGAVLGALAGSRGGLADELMMRVADFVLILPVLYVVVVLRAVLPLVLAPGVVFVLMLAIFVLVGWPLVARGVRALVARERTSEYVVASQAAGAGSVHVLRRHLLPACAGHVAVQASLLLPGFVLAEATLSYLGLGFPDTVPTWGTMLREAADINELTRFPWTLAPAAAIFVVTLATNAALQPVAEIVRSSDQIARSPDEIAGSPDEITRSPAHQIRSTDHKVTTS